MRNKVFYNEVYNRNNGCCINCGISQSIEEMEFHHVIPLSIGGNDVASNIVCLCSKCHKLLHGISNNGIISHSALTKAGLQKARKRGAQIGLVKGTRLTTNKSLIIKPQIIAMSKNFRGTMTNADVIRELGIAKNTYYKYQQELLSIDWEKEFPIKT